MHNEQEKELQKSLDYITMYADGIILQLGEDVSRLIFYQDDLELTDENTAIDNKKKVKQLNFEVRIPNSVAQRFVNNANQMYTLKNEPLRICQEDRESSSGVINRTWQDYLNKVTSVLYDTDDFDERYTTDSNQVKELGKEYDRLKDGV
jgi:hypothetical protein